MPESHNPIRTVIIGFGRNGETMHGEPLRELPGFELHAVVETNVSRHPLIAEKFHAQPYADYREMLDRTQPQLAVIVTSNDQHVAMAKGLPARRGRCAGHQTLGPEWCRGTQHAGCGDRMRAKGAALAADAL